MINQVTLAGRLTADPELRYTPSGIPFAFFTLAIRRDYRNQQGDVDTDFVRIRVWRKQAENLANFCRKGDIIGMEGKIQTGSYEDQTGKRIYTTDVVADKISFIYLKSRENSQGQGSYNNNQGGGYGNGGYPQNQGNGGYPQNQGGGYGNGGYPQNQGGGYGNGGYPQNQGGYSGNGGGNHQQNNQPPQNQTNYSRVDEDPFANSKGPIEVSEDDLPF